MFEAFEATTQTPQNPSRRDFLRNLGIFTAALAVPGFRSTLPLQDSINYGVSVNDVLEIPELPDDYRPITKMIEEFIKDKYEDSKFDDSNKGILRAASLNMSDKNGYGHGGLISVNDRYYFLTIKHVAKSLDQEAQINIPGIGIRRIDGQAFEVIKHNDNIEPAAYYPVSAEISSEIEYLRESGGIEPLTLATVKPNKNDILVLARADIGRFTEHLVLEQNLKERSFGVLAAYDTCRGQSGSPYLRMVDGLPTNQIVGVVSQKEGEEKIDQVRRDNMCGAQIWGRQLDSNSVSI